MNRRDEPGMIAGGRPARDPMDLPAMRDTSTAERGVDRLQGAGVGPGVRHGFRDGLVWTVVGGVIGALLALPIAFFVFEDIELLGRLVILGAAGFLAGSIVGWSLGAGRSDDDADNGLAGRDERGEELAGFHGHPERTRRRTS